jgi:hypothetical protein
MRRVLTTRENVRCQVRGFWRMFGGPDVCVRLAWFCRVHCCPDGHAYAGRTEHDCCYVCGSRRRALYLSHSYGSLLTASAAVIDWDSEGSWQQPCKQVCCGLGTLLLLLLLTVVTTSHTTQCDYLTHGRSPALLL